MAPTTALISLAFINDANSISTAEEWNRVDINLLSAAPLPRLSVMEGAIKTRVSSGSGFSPILNFKATSIAKASRIDITSDGRSAFSNIHGKSSRVMS